MSLIASSSSCVSSLAKLWRRALSVEALLTKLPLRAPPLPPKLPRLGLGPGGGIGRHLTRVGVQNTPDGCHEKEPNLTFIASVAVLVVK